MVRFTHASYGMNITAMMARTMLPWLGRCPPLRAKTTTHETSAASSRNAFTMTNQCGLPRGLRTIAHIAPEVTDIVHAKIAAKQMASALDEACPALGDRLDPPSGDWRVCMQATSFYTAGCRSMPDHSASRHGTVAIVNFMHSDPVRRGG